MWLWLLIQLAPIRPAFNSAWALENGSSNGPVSVEEGRILWQNGRKAFEDGRYQDAVNDLQRLVDRYPGYPGYLEAHRYLGRALMLVGEYEKAKPPLKYYINATGDQPLALKAQLWLGEDYLMTSKPTEAYLAALRIEKKTQKTAGKTADPALYAESQFLKTRALIALNQDRRAQQVVDSIELDPFVQSSGVLKGHLARAQIELKLRSCDRLPKPSTQGKHVTLDEGQIREQFTRRALCLQESLVLFKTATESHDEETMRDASRRIAEAYTAYAEAVQNPPDPPRLKPTDRTAAEKKQYRAELMDRLEQDRQKAVKDAADTLSNWRSKAETQTPSDSQAAASYGDILKQIQAAPQVTPKVVQ